MRILSLDPGKTTGVASVHDDAIVTGEFDWRQLCVQLQRLVQVVDLVVAERFTINQRTVRNTQAPWSLEVIGAVRYVTGLQPFPVPFELQSPADAKTFATDAKLRERGWWTPGKPHANDAARHALLAIARHSPGDL